MRVSEIGVKRIRVNQGLGVEAEGSTESKKEADWEQTGSRLQD